MQGNFLSLKSDIIASTFGWQTKPLCCSQLFFSPAGSQDSPDARFILHYFIFFRAHLFCREKSIGNLINGNLFVDAFCSGSLKPALFPPTPSFWVDQLPATTWWRTISLVSVSPGYIPSVPYVCIVMVFRGYLLQVWNSSGTRAWCSNTHELSCT